MQHPLLRTSGASGFLQEADVLVDAICMRQDGIKLRPEELRTEQPRRGHLHVDHGEARLTTQPDGPASASDVFAPLDHAHLYRISDEAWVLYGYEHPNGSQGHKQAWYCTLAQ